MIDFRLNSFVRFQIIFRNPCYSDFFLSNSGQEERTNFLLVSVQVQFLKHFTVLHRLSLRGQVQVNGVDVILHLLPLFIN